MRRWYLQRVEQPTESPSRSHWPFRSQPAPISPLAVTVWERVGDCFRCELTLQF